MLFFLLSYTGSTRYFYINLIIILNENTIFVNGNGKNTTKLFSNEE